MAAMKSSKCNLLAIDTALSSCSVAVIKSGSIAAVRLQEMVRGQSEALLPMAAATLTDANIDWVDLDVLAVTVGPGAFTGLRIGLAAVRGLGLSLNLPMIGVTTMETIARATTVNERSTVMIMVVVESRREDLFVQCFDRNLKEISDIQACLPENLKDLVKMQSVLLCGDGTERAAKALIKSGVQVDISQSAKLPNADSVALIAYERWQRDKDKISVDRTPPSPIYVRPPDAIKPHLGGRLRP